jgi:1-acyl-sn-glycerol-3-phosphate acyltransferase
MSSTELSPRSSAPERYTGLDYREVVAGRWGAADPLLHPDPQRPPRLYGFVVALVYWLLPRLFRIEVIGRENIPPAPFILASNHQRWFDPLFLLLALPPAPMLYSMARRDTVFNRGWKRALVRRVGVFAIQPFQGELDRTGVASVYHVLSRGGIVLIFPEGRYSSGRRLRPLKKGVAHFALQAGVPVVPVALDGLDRLRLFGRVTISIGTPVWPDPPSWWDPSRRVVKLVDSVRRAILTAFDRRPAREPGRIRRFGRRVAGRLRLRRRDRGSATEPPGR